MCGLNWSHCALITERELSYSTSIEVRGKTGGRLRVLTAPGTYIRDLCALVRDGAPSGDHTPIIHPFTAQCSDATVTESLLSAQTPWRQRAATLRH